MNYSLIQIETFPFAIIGVLVSIRWALRRFAATRLWIIRVTNAVKNSSHQGNSIQDLWNAMREVQHRLDKLENERKHKP